MSPFFQDTAAKHGLHLHRYTDGLLYVSPSAAPVTETQGHEAYSLRFPCLLDILASGNLNSRNVETGVPEHGNRLDWLNGYLSGATHLSSQEPLCGAKQALQLSCN